MEWTWLLPASSLVVLRIDDCSVGSELLSKGTMTTTLLEAGDRVPIFTLYATTTETASLEQHRGTPVILASYPADWSPVCGDQMVLYNQVLSEFTKFGATLFGISVDGKWCHRAFAEARKLKFRLLADFEPKGAVAKAYGTYRETEGIAERVLFVIDKDGIVSWSYCSPIGVNPGADGILDAPQELSEK